MLDIFKLRKYKVVAIFRTTRVQWFKRPHNVVGTIPSRHTWTGISFKMKRNRNSLIRSLEA